MDSSKIEKLKNYSYFNPTEIQEIKDTLLNLAIKSNDEINKNKILKEIIEFKKNEINQYKVYLSIRSSDKKNSDENNKSIMENELIKNNKKLFDSNEIIKSEIKSLKNKYEINSVNLERNLKQQKNVLEALEETNFILENKIKEKEAMIDKIKEIEFDITLNVNEISNEIGPEVFNNLKEYKNAIDYSLILNEEYFREYLLYKSIKFNKIKNKINKLVEKKKKLENIINNNNNQNLKNIITLININNYTDNIDNTFIEENKNNLNKDILNKSNDIIIPTNVTTENSIFSMNDSLYFDTEEQIDVELPENDFSSYYLSQKSLGFNIIKKKLIIPHLNLKQIKYNAYKNKIGSSDREISLSRSFENDTTHRIKAIKNQIKSYKRQNINLDKKCQKYEQKIKQIALILYSNSKSKFIIKNNNDN